MAEVEESEAPFSGEPKKMFVTKHRLVLIFILLIIIILFVLLYFLSRPKSDYLTLSGRLEGYETDIAPKYGGKVTYIIGREGMAIHKNELLVKLDDSELKAQLKAAEANLAISRQQKKQAILQLNIIENQILQATLNVTQSKDESQGIITQAQSNLASAKVQLLQAQQQLKQS
ncbi:MAG: hypothetical protein PHC34_14015, partial [Candidatus Gastranaerophilales bacterium]|nr:hypothetical protein [Candidatus Gastranaerophilales bacterium]